MRTRTRILDGLSVLLSFGLWISGCGSDAAAGPDCGAGDDAEVCEVFRLVNEARSSEGLPPYEWSFELALSAQRHAEDMVAQGYFSHTSRDGRSFSDRTREAGYDGRPRGENIARGQSTPAAVMSSWLSSSGHRANILASDSNEIGIGREGRTWVQVFGAKR